MLPSMGLGMRALMAPARLAAAAGRAHAAFGEVGGYRQLFRNRTAIGAAVGGLYGASGENGSFKGAMMGAAAGAGAARYGGAFLSWGAIRGVSLGRAAKGTAAFMKNDARRLARLADMRGQSVGSLIGRTHVAANAGYNKFRGLAGRGMAHTRGMRYGM